MVTSPLLEEVSKYEEKVLNGEIFCAVTDCPRCRGSPGTFKAHETRKRTWLVITGRLVEKVLSLLIRWRCPMCGKTFTLPPSFGMRNKRYVNQVVLEYGIRYLEEEQMTYRKGIRKEGLPIFHAGDQEEEIDDRSLAPSTLYRWLTTLGNLGQAVRAAGKLLESKATDLHRDPLVVFPPKYRSKERKGILEECLLLFRVEREWRFHFKVSAFPRLATGWG